MGKVIVFQKGSLERKQINALFSLFERLIEFAPGRAVAKIYRENDSVFVKRYRRSMKPWWKRILRRAYRSPLRSEAMLLSRLQLLDFPAPKPLMYAESRRPGFHESLLLTGFLPGVPLATLSGDDLLAGARQCLVLLGQLHAHGIVHGDCNPYNFLVSEHAHLLDFERAGDFTQHGAVEDFKKIMLRLGDLGLDESSLSDVAGAYSLGAGAPVFDVQASLLELRSMAFCPKADTLAPTSGIAHRSACPLNQWFLHLISGDEMSMLARDNLTHLLPCRFGCRFPDGTILRFAPEPASHA